jgi:antitoxin (DNA-binding transcriptional repressor) of toxin-antitoxin stability system
MQTVSVAEFRSNLARYLRKAKYSGARLVIVDSKRGEPLAEVGPVVDLVGASLSEFLDARKNDSTAYWSPEDDQGLQKVSKLTSEQLRDLNV